MVRHVVYIADSHSAEFDVARQAVDVVCAGDSLTGWNNFGPVSYWPYPTYTRFMQELCRPLDLTIADGGIAGEVSGNGLGHVRRYLDLFPNARQFVIGFGTNDLGGATDLEATSTFIIGALDSMVDAVREAGRQPVLFNVPYVNEAMFPQTLASQLHEQRDYHNGLLAQYCAKTKVPLADICSCLRDEHFGDEVHPNEAGARIIAERVFEVLRGVLAN
jgi:lysophospholipase L1-like esterase